jgi:glucosylglycerate phosphorylase
MDKLERVLLRQCAFIYGKEQAKVICQQILDQLDLFQVAHPKLAAATPISHVSERDSILITYGDMVQTEGQAHLQTLSNFLLKSVGNVLSTVHILPFFPYSSDDGFSVIDYLRVNPDLGDWDDISDLGTNYRLMFDAVINHISARSEWFTGFLEGNPEYENYFYVVDGSFDTSRVFRPRTLPLLTEFKTPSGHQKVWTTFSADQIDLNYENHNLLQAVIDVLLEYVSQGADFIRLDAVGFIWKESGTRCLHQPEAHRIIQLLRTVLDIVAPQVAIITETNVPHVENISYFGDGTNEAQMVYNFTLPPLTLHAIHTGNAETISAWAKTLSQPSRQTTFFNFLASHDGVGLMPVRGILPESEIEKMAQRTEAVGGFVSYKNNPDGTQMAYEMNVNYLDALSDPANLDESLQLKATRFLCSQAIMLVLRGVPGIYFHSLFGSQNWIEGANITGRNRTINREKLTLERLENELAQTGSLRNLVFNGYRRMLSVRQENPAFHPNGGQEILNLHPAIFAILRTSRDANNSVLCVQNVSAESIEFEIELTKTPFTTAEHFTDIITGREFEIGDTLAKIEVTPYQVLWLITA